MAFYDGTDEDDDFLGTRMSDIMFGGAGDDRLRGGRGEDVLNGGDGNDNIRGGEDFDIIAGDGGDDRLFGDGGGDIIRSGAGVDYIDGGDGTDRISFFAAAATQGAYVDLRTGIMRNDGFGNRERISSIEDLGAGTLFADVFIGNDGDNFLWIDAGDTALGLGGDDEIRVGAVAGATIDGGDGYDTLSADGGTGGLVDANTLGLFYSDRGFVIDMQRGVLTDGFGGTTSFSGFEAILGSARGDEIVGSKTHDDIFGVDGDDRLFGGGGSDLIDGGAGNDLVDGGDENDLLVGGAGTDTLRGGEGDDTIGGGDGIDRLFGGSGRDYFTFRVGDTGTTLQTADRLLDFSQTDNDHIDFRSALGRPVFIGTQAFSGAAGEIRYENRGDGTFVFFDADGLAGADVIIRLAGEFTLTANDFRL